MNLIQYINTNYDANLTEDQLPFSINKVKAKKGKVIYPYEEICDKIYFLNEGLVETTVFLSGQERTVSFIFAGYFFYSVESVATQTPSDLQGVALTDCSYEWIYHRDFEKLCETSLLANRVGRVEAERYYINKLIREKQFLTMSKEEIYQDMVRANPEIIREIPLNRIANFLGIQPETLSRIRKKSIT